VIVTYSLFLRVALAFIKVIFGRLNAPKIKCSERSINTFEPIYGFGSQ
jgi:hypothetical protein